MNMQDSYLTSKPHYEILDGLRGVAAAMVVAFHLLEAHSGGNHLNQIINHGYLAVDFFFMLSGFVIGYAYDDRWNKMSTGTFFKRRLIRLQPMVVMGSIVGAALFWFQEAPCYPAMEGVSVGPPKKGYISRISPTYCCSQFKAHPPTMSPAGAVRQRCTVKHAAIATRTVSAVLLNLRINKAYSMLPMYS